MKVKKCLVSILFFWGATTYFQFLFAQDNNFGESVLQLRPNDPKAVYFTRENFNASADGVGDNADALQAAIDLVEKQSRNGIVFIPEGSYRLGKTVRLWNGIRLIGFGTNRPVFKLAENTPGFQEGEGKYMVHFCHTRGSGNNPQPGSWSSIQFIDGTWSTFYSGIYNINFEIGNANPAAIAVRFHIAQGCALENIDFNIGNGLGAVEEMGNIIENCTFRGGEYGIKTNSSPPEWQCMVLDCSFKGQRKASMLTEEAKMLVIHCRFKDTPTGIMVPGIEKLFVKDTRFEDIKNSAITVNSFTPPGNQVNLDNVQFSNVPYYLRFAGRTQGRPADEVQMDFKSPAAAFVIKSFSHGILIESSDGYKSSRKFATTKEEIPLESPGELSPGDIPRLPAQKTWINISDMGAKGDGTTDCSAVFEKAIAKYDAIFIPTGRYLISKTLTLRDKTSLIGLHPLMTQFVLKDGTPGFIDATNPKALLVAPENGSDCISGIGFDLGVNPGVIGIKWMAGVQSYFNDSYFRGGRAEVRGEGQSYSLWITNGGGGTFKNFWIPDSRAKFAFYVSDTKTPGKIYEISIEHHKELEVKLENVENWSFYALQIEEDRGSEKALGIYLNDCRNILFANLVSHRTSGVWEPYYTAIRIRNSKDLTIRGCEIRGAIFPFDNAVFDEITGMVIQDILFTKLEIK